MMLPPNKVKPLRSFLSQDHKDMMSNCELMKKSLKTPVTEIKGSGWPGTHRNVKLWYKLDDGVLIGVNEFRGVQKLVRCIIEEM